MDVPIVVYLTYRKSVGQETWKKWEEEKEKQSEQNQFPVSSVLFYLPHYATST